jgi:hypothetical protein
MKIEVFKDILSRIRKADDVVSDLYRTIDVTNITNDYNEIITTLLKCYYGKEAADWISSYLYEKGESKEPWAWDENNKEILNNDEELWAYCEELRMVKIDYDLPTPMTDEQRAELIQLITDAFQ